MSGVSRQFLNLIVDHGFPGVRSLCRIDLTLHQLFHPTASPHPPNGAGSGATTAAGLTMDSLPLPNPSFTFRSSAPDDDHGKIDCFPLADCAVISADHLGHAFRLDARTLLAGTLPSLHKPKSTPLSLFVPNAGADTDFTRNRNPLGSSLFVMEKFPKPELSCGGAPHNSDQFEAFVFHKVRLSDYIKAWHCHLLPPPPFVREPEHWRGGAGGKPPEIGSYGVVGGGSHVCISVEGVGTYCLETASHTWSEVGKWALPFIGKVEYVPELKLLFGFSGDARRLAAADLSAMDSQPQLVGAWEELCLPEQWKECRDPQFVNLGSGRFCIARFFPTAAADDLADGSSSCKDFAVLTGVEVVPQQVRDNNGNGDNGKAELGMVPHKSRRVSGASIEALF
ncbi:unnamed protein product [Urochloa decumbens]|uniref:Uncharacterized protein n=1 Tax=Urochloa decumbens TaxID=240449 RepID=A0ABC9G0R4_9POAL